MTATAATGAPAGQGPPQPERPDVFISYSRAEEEFVRRLAAALEARGKDVWVDWEDIRKSADWRAKIEAGIDSARTIVAVLSSSFAESEVCDEEIEHAVRNILTGGGDNDARVYPCEICGSTEQLLTLAGRRVNRSLTEEERQRYSVGG